MIQIKVALTTRIFEWPEELICLWISHQIFESVSTSDFWTLSAIWIIRNWNLEKITPILIALKSCFLRKSHYSHSRFNQGSEKWRTRIMNQCRIQYLVCLIIASREHKTHLALKTPLPLASAWKLKTSGTDGRPVSFCVSLPSVAAPSQWTRRGDVKVHWSLKAQQPIYPITRRRAVYRTAERLLRLFYDPSSPRFTVFSHTLSKHLAKSDFDVNSGYCLLHYPNMLPYYACVYRPWIAILGFLSRLLYFQI